MNYTYRSDDDTEIVLKRRIDDRDKHITDDEISENGYDETYLGKTYKRVEIEWNGKFVLQGRGWFRDGYDLNHKKRK